MIPSAVAEAAARAQRELSGRVLAVTLRSVRDLDIAEEATADAFLLALQTWPERGVPASVEAWLITAARRRAIDRIRTAQAARRALLRSTAGREHHGEAADVGTELGVIGDEDLRLVVLCCDPRIAVQDQIALTLRLACGVSTAAIAAAFLLSETSMAARLTRAKKRLAAAGPALDLPDDATVDARLPAVRRVVYLAFTLGHTAASGPDLTDDQLSDRARYLAGALHRLRPADPEFTGLLALIMLTGARAGGRLDDDGRQALLDAADRRRWDRELVHRGLALVDSALADSARADSARADSARADSSLVESGLADGAPLPGRSTSGRPGPMTLQAAIAAEHAIAPTLAATNWARVVDLYGQLLSLEPSATIAVGRCVAISQLRGPAAGLADFDEVFELGGLERYPYAHGARAQMLAALGREQEAAQAWSTAAEFARTVAERDYFAAQGRAAGT